MRAVTLGILRSPLAAKLCVGVFLTLLVLPMLGQMAAVGTDVRAIEMREPNALPSLPADAAELAALPRRFEAWLNDHFGFRRYLVLANTKLRVRIFNESPLPSVVVGQNGWLFYNGERSIEQVRGVDLFPPAELDRWIDVMERRHAWLAERGIPLLIVAIPNKERVYREELPAWVTQVKADSRLDQITRRLAERRSPLAFIDLTPDLVAAKPAMKVYLRADTHWTGEAAFAIGYQRIMAWIKGVWPDLRPLTERDMRRTPTYRRDNDLDLARLLGPEAVTEEENIRYEFLEPSKFRAIESSTSKGIALDITHADRPSAPSVVWFRDSFTLSILPYISDTFRTAVVTEHKGLTFDKALIEERKPDVVVYQFVERFLAQPIPAE